MNDLTTTARTLVDTLTQITNPDNGGSKNSKVLLHAQAANFATRDSIYFGERGLTQVAATHAQYAIKEIETMRRAAPPTERANMDASELPYLLQAYKEATDKYAPK